MGPRTNLYTPLESPVQERSAARVVPLVVTSPATTHGRGAEPGSAANRNAATRLASRSATTLRDTDVAWDTAGGGETKATTGGRASTMRRRATVLPGLPAKSTAVYDGGGTNHSRAHGREVTRQEGHTRRQVQVTALRGDKHGL